MSRKELFAMFEKEFRDQLSLELSDVVTIIDDKFVLKMELMALSIGSLNIKLSPEQSGYMADFLEQVQKDNA